MDEPVTGSLHHVELWMPDLGRAVQQWSLITPRRRPPITGASSLMSAGPVPRAVPMT
jgi:hypothetical protein